MNRANEPWHFRRRIVQACLRKSGPAGHGMRRPEPSETPLSNDEIFFGACRGIIRVPPLSPALQRPYDAAGKQALTTADHPAPACAEGGAL